LGATDEHLSGRAETKATEGDTSYFKGFGSGARETSSSATKASRMLNSCERLFSSSNARTASTSKRSMIMPFGLADDVSACQRGLKLKPFIIGNERNCGVSGEHRADCFVLDGEGVGLDSEKVQCPHAGVVSVKLERHQAVDSGCNCRRGEAWPPRIFAQVIAHHHRRADGGVQARPLAETLLKIIYLNCEL